ncbi:MAG TPA: hypothetical protein K8U78_05600 [Aeriscardovia aeriphila]|uniref:Uncharacterized protein n=1 Tax=Aeriscardovia aeriphila TaxID=218139 RepID=A0A921FUR8_9BIFI|nr:hypothetical protein [Aeriscardovia aeriphila]
MTDINKVLFSLLEGIWSSQEEKEAHDLEDCGESFIATYCAYKSMQKHHISVPEKIKPAVLGIVKDFL